ncbi:MAG: AMP-binding protein [Anaerolineae bacterium]
MSPQSLQPIEDVPGAHPWLRHYDATVPAHIDYPHVPLYTLLDDTAARQPNKAALLFYGRSFVFRDLKSHSDMLASNLRHLGVKPGDRVALLMPNMPQFVVAYYGILKAGAVVVPLNPLYTERELTFQLTDAGVETVITIPLFLDKVARLVDATPLKRVICARLADALPFPLSVAQRVRESRMMRQGKGLTLLDFKTLADRPAPTDFRPAAVDPSDMAVLIYSGGTTGIAKGIMLSHNACVANAYQISAWGNLRGDERMLAVLPLFHGFGMSVTMNAPILHGGTTVLMPRFNAKDVVKAIQKFRPTFFIGVPTMFVALSNLPDIERYDLSSLEGIFVGAAPLTQAIKENFEAKTGARMIEGYGLTEAR